MGGRHFYTYDAFNEVSLTDAYVIYSAVPQPSLARVTNKTQNTMLLKDRIKGRFTSGTWRSQGAFWQVKLYLNLRKWENDSDAYGLQ